jgi:transposase InsO family protein
MGLKSILGEFLQRARFDRFEQAVERTAFWVKYYNYKRPHQGIGGSGFRGPETDSFH